MLMVISVRAENTTSLSSNIFIGVERKIEFLKSGYTTIKDTFLLSISNKSSINSVLTLDSFVVGIPRNYSRNLIYYSAYDALGNLSIVKGEGNEDFQWLEISFPEPIQLNHIEKYNFTVMYVFSDLIRKKPGAENLFHATFPLYPSLIYDVVYCNVTVMLPSTAKVSQDNFPQDIFINKTKNFRILNNFTSPLPAYANVSSWVEFSSPTFPLFKILELKRDLSIDSLGRITVTDFYEISTVNLKEIAFILPSNATDISVYDAYGKYPKYRVWVAKQSPISVVKVTLDEKLKNTKRGKIAIAYTLPFSQYVTRNNWQNYILKVNVTRPNEWIIKRIIIIVTLPEGANFVQEKQGNFEIKRIGFFQERAIFEYYNVTKFQDLVISVNYQYMPLWAAFRPTILAGTLIGVVSLILFFTRSTKAGAAISAPATPISPETIRKFTEAYEERLHILSDIDYLEHQLRRKKISRRQYRFRRRTLDKRLSAVQRTIINLQREIEAVGGRYVDMMRRLEAVSTDIEAINRSIADVEMRYRRGEISAEAYRQLLREYRRRKDEDEDVIEEIILKLKEET